MKNKDMPQILSFEYSKDKNLINKIINYINLFKINSLSISGLIPIQLLDKINSNFISIDLNFFLLNSKELNYLKKYNKRIKQIRYIIDGIINQNYFINDLNIIKNEFKGSKILFFCYYGSTISNNQIDNNIKLAIKHNFTPSFLFLNYNNFEINQLIKIFKKYKKEILNHQILIDSPEILKKTTNKKYICPASKFMIYVDGLGNVKNCKFDSLIYGNIKSENIEKIINKKNVFLKKTTGTKCYINNLYSPYENFSFFYNKMMTQKNELYNNYVEFIFKRFKNKKIRILDAACGPGLLIKKLVKEGYDNIDGLDISKEMVNFAKKNTRKKIFYSNLKNYNSNFQKKYDLILCTFDSLNYILDKKSLNKTINNLFRYLKNGGFLLFDINHISKFDNHYNNLHIEKLNNTAITMISSYRKPYWKLIIEIKNNSSFQEIHFERLLAKKEIKQLLLNNNFLNIKIYNYLTNSSAKKKGRIYIIAQKIKK